MATLTAEDRVATNRRTAEGMLQEIILPALATARDELHRPTQQQYVTVTPLSSTAAELTIARTPPAEGAEAADGLRYVLTIAYGSQVVVVKRHVDGNGKRASFLGQHHAGNLRSQAIVDDVRRVWRRAEQQHEAR